MTMCDEFEGVVFFQVNSFSERNEEKNKHFLSNMRSEIRSLYYHLFFKNEFCQDFEISSRLSLCERLMGGF